MTEHYFEHPLVRLHYYRFGTGKQNMLCFHGYGMHGKQFRILEPVLGDKYTFYGFDLFFHQETRLHNESLDEVKRGISKQELSELIEAFCKHETIGRFSVIGYSMGSHHATTIVEQLPQFVNEYIVIAPSSLRPVPLIYFLSTNSRGNRIFEKLMLSNNGLRRLLHLCKFLRIIDDTGHKILYNEIGTPELRFSFYASVTYIRHLATNEPHLIKVLNEQNIKSIFIFGKRDFMYPERIGRKLVTKLKIAKSITLDENHDMINHNLATTLSRTLL